MLSASCGFALFIILFSCQVNRAEDSALAASSIPLSEYWESREKPIQDQKIIQRNLTVYMGYPNNPFGPSTRLQRKKEKKLNISFPQPIEKANGGGDDSSENSVDGKAQSSYESRSKRGVVQLYNMVSCATGCNPLIYKGYGCYCGFLGSGKPVDGIDRCCQNHDWCYDTANCNMYFEYIVPYYWKCYRRQSLCAIDHLEWGGSGSCAQRLCECDRVLSECLSQYPCPRSRARCTSSLPRLLQNAFMIF